MAQETAAAAAPAAAAPRRPDATAPPKRHRFEFHRAGGLDQVALGTGADLLALEQLDQKLWIALSCPTKGLELDPRTLELLDLDRDGRVRVPEVLSAIRFCAARLRDVGVVLYGADEIALAALRDDTPEGKAALGAARYVLAQLGRADAAAIGAADVADTTKVFERTLFNGDGVVPPEAAADLEARQVVQDVLATIGGTPDRGAIVKIVENPISLREAFFAPYKKFLRFVEEQVAKFAASKAAATDDRLKSAAADGTDVALQQKAPPGAPPVDVGKMVGIIAALGVGIGALGALLGGFVAGFMELQPWWAKLVAVGGVILLVSGPSLLIAWMKLRHRTLGPVLDGCGWAVNGRVKINLPLGTALTQRAALPPGARRVLEDPYVDRGAKRRRRVFWLVLVLVAAALVAARVLGHWPFGPPFWVH